MNAHAGKCTTCQISDMQHLIAVNLCSARSLTYATHHGIHAKTWWNHASKYIAISRVLHHKHESLACKLRCVRCFRATKAARPALVTRRQPFMLRWRKGAWQDPRACIPSSSTRHPFCKETLVRWGSCPQDLNPAPADQHAGLSSVP